MEQKQQSEKSIPQQTATQWYREQVENLKKQLPKDFKIKLLAFLPKEYDTYRGGLTIQNVLYGNSTDMNILEGLKKVVENENRNSDSPDAV